MDHVNDSPCPLAFSWGLLMGSPNRKSEEGRREAEYLLPLLVTFCAGSLWADYILWLGHKSFQGVPLHEILCLGSGNCFLSSPFRPAGVY